jgi:hypothetical protein
VHLPGLSHPRESRGAMVRARARSRVQGESKGAHTRRAGARSSTRLLPALPLPFSPPTRSTSASTAAVAQPKLSAMLRRRRPPPPPPPRRGPHVTRARAVRIPGSTPKGKPLGPDGALTEHIADVQSAVTGCRDVVILDRWVGFESPLLLSNNLPLPHLH